ncbi:MAG: MarR family transcriptional regulator [Gemmatimonadaceae bacterium]
MGRIARSSDPEQDAALKLWVVLSRAHQSVGELAKLDVGRGELSLTEFAVLEVLYHQGDLAAGEVSERVLLQSGSLTYVIDKLAERGLIERLSCDTDGRRRYLHLTAAGKAIMKRIWPGHAAVIQLATSGLTAAEQRTATRLLKKLGLHAAGVDEREPK